IHHVPSPHASIHPGSSRPPVSSYTPAEHQGTATSPSTSSQFTFIEGLLATPCGRS
ncbi:hypothetical protein NDU88_004370, partial [Pleurodeles waltl]